MAQRRNSIEKLQDYATATETQNTYDQKNVGIRYQLPLKPYWLDWLKESLENHEWYCAYAGKDEEKNAAVMLRKQLHAC